MKYKGKVRIQRRSMNTPQARIVGLAAMARISRRPIRKPLNTKNNSTPKKPDTLSHHGA